MTDVPPGVVTLTLTGPVAVLAGECAVISVEDTDVMCVPEAVPNLTAVVPVRFVPLMVTFVLPVNDPEVGLSDVTVGAGGLAATVRVTALAATVVEPITERENA
jgi:hypothetical protein